MTHAPTGMLTPSLDGEVTSYFEWVEAGEIEVSSAAGAMHQVAPSSRQEVTGVRFGYDRDHLYVRVDLARRAQDVLADKGQVRLTFFAPAGVRVAVERDGAEITVRMLDQTSPGDWRARPAHRARAAAATIVELGVPFADLGVKAGQPLSFSVGLFRDGHALEQYPPHRPLDLIVPGADFAARHWSV